MEFHKYGFRFADELLREKRQQLDGARMRDIGRQRVAFRSVGAPARPAAAGRCFAFAQGRERTGAGAPSRGTFVFGFDLIDDGLARRNLARPECRTTLVLLRSVEFDDGAATEPEHLMDRHGARAQHHRNIDRNVVQCCHFAPPFRLWR